MRKYPENIVQSGTIVIKFSKPVGEAQLNISPFSLFAASFFRKSIFHEIVLLQKNLVKQRKLAMFSPSSARRKVTKSF